ncbi:MULTISPECIES: hypothetical protein [unclassified Sphingomonas]|jgi:hypothetical protein|uniref:hypothetical protein n=1 Tax=unclassified Sphingomonas TaxID=196159 RepID=UPI000E10560F|nr:MULTISPECIES: hypothetical protein [unclassified Sphingomonas]AXJ95300.1 hypothetical protein DM480_07040 [Sphingomonas sp. FARSPH]
MSQDVAVAAHKVRDEFIPAEQAADIAAARTARLLATVLEQRAAAGVAMGMGAPMIRKIAKSLAAQIEAREEFVMAHKLAAALPGEMGLDPMMFGDASECPPDEQRPSGFGGAHENVVAIRAA